MFISKNDLKTLSLYHNEKGAISLYVFSPLGDNVHDFSERLNSLFNKMIKDISRHAYSRVMAEDDGYVLGTKDMLIQNFVENKLKTYCMFISEDFCRYYEVPVRVKDQIVVDEKFYTTPLFMALNQLERFAVLIFDRKKARLYNYYAGKLHEETFVLHDYGLSNIKSASMKGKTIDNKMDENFHHHLKGISAVLLTYYKRHSFDKLILGSHKDGVNMIKEYLHSYLKQRLAGEIIADPDENKENILKKVNQAVEIYRKDMEHKKIEKLLAMQAYHKAVHGLDAVLSELEMNNIRELVITSDFHAEGYACPERHLIELESQPQAECPYCHKALRKEPFLEDELKEAVFLRKGLIFHIFHFPGAEDFPKIGAFLRHS